MDSLRGFLKERPVNQQQCASEFSAGQGTDGALQRSVSRSGRAMQCYESKHAGGAKQRRPVRINPDPPERIGSDAPGIPYLPGACVDTSSGCMMQAQQRERRQYTPSNGKQPLTLVRCCGGASSAGAMACSILG